MREVVHRKCSPDTFWKIFRRIEGYPYLEVGKLAVQAAVKRAGIKLEDIEEMYFGNCLSAEAETPSVIGRQVAIQAGIRPEVMTVTVDTACCSALLAVRLAYQSIANSTTDVALAPAG